MHCYKNLLVEYLGAWLNLSFHATNKQRTAIKIYWLSILQNE